MFKPVPGRRTGEVLNRRKVGRNSGKCSTIYEKTFKIFWKNFEIIQTIEDVSKKLCEHYENSGNIGKFMEIIYKETKEIFCWNFKNILKKWGGGGILENIWDSYRWMLKNFSPPPQPKKLTQNKSETYCSQIRYTDYQWHNLWECYFLLQWHHRKLCNY